jgi:hypothetical protein
MWRLGRRPHAIVPDMRIDIDLGEEDLRVLRGALLAAKATELAELHRRDIRLSVGYGTDTAREGMTAEVDQRRQRVELLDRLIQALEAQPTS